MKKKVLSAMLAGTMALSLLSACGSEKPQNIADVTTGSSSAAASSAAAAPAEKQEMTFVLNNIPDGLDPGVTNNSFAQYVLINCFEGLVTYDETGSLVAARPKAGISATTAWSTPSTCGTA